MDLDDFCLQTSMSGISVTEDAVNLYYFLKAKSTVSTASKVFNPASNQSQATKQNTLQCPMRVGTRQEVIFRNPSSNMWMLSVAC